MTQAIEETPKADNMVDKLSIEEQLQLAAANFGGTIESRLAGAAIATVVSRMVQLDEQDQRDLFECVKDLSTIKTPEDAQETMKTILEILEPKRKTNSLKSLEEMGTGRSRDNYQAWLVFISKKLRDCREQKNMTQDDVARAAGLPQSHISRLERGMHSPSRKTLQKIAEALHVDVSYFSLEDPT
jgi:DNA-binding XRE family transcriptional regulator